MTVVVSHGTEYFQNKGVRCPECKDRLYSIHHVTSSMDKRLYYFDCGKCKCSWQEVCDE